MVLEVSIAMTLVLGGGCLGGGAVVILHLLTWGPVIQTCSLRTRHQAVLLSVAFLYVHYTSTLFKFIVKTSCFYGASD